MNPTDAPSLAAAGPAPSVRAITARFAHPDEPLAGWTVEFDEWRAAIQDLKEFERKRLDGVATPSAQTMREHRYLLLLLRSRGEELALRLTGIPGVPPDGIQRLTAQVDVFLEDLWMSWVDWHAETNPVHREMIFA